MAQHPDVLIIGGGVIGLTTAWYLAGEGARVALVDQGEIGRQASWAGAGILPPAEVSHARSALDLLRAHSIRLYPEISRQLRDETGIDNGYAVCGGIELPEGDDDDLPTEEWHGEGVAFERLDRAGLDRHQTGLSAAVTRGVYLPGMAQVRNPWHLRALQAGCARRGVALTPGWPVERFFLQGAHVVAAEGPAGRIAAGQYLVTAGAWSARLLRQVGWAPDIRPIRGQIALFNTGQAGVRPILMQGKRYLVPRGDGRVLAGSTEEDAGFDARPTGGGVGGILTFATRLVPSLAEATLEMCWAGLRPGSPGGVPYLGRVPGYENLHVAAGHFRAGLQLSPATGVVMAQHLLGKPTLVGLEAFGPDRAGGAW
jgi:glycine oxidase